jgi:hypothetical protein
MSLCLQAETSIGTYRYFDAGFHAIQKQLDALASASTLEKGPPGTSSGRGAGEAEVERFIHAVYVEKNRAIRNQDFSKLDPATVAEDYLLPRRDLCFFVVYNWLRHVFLPSLEAATLEGMLVFGIGRLFSSYNDTGVQRSTDADINIVVRDDLPAAPRAELVRRLRDLKKTLLEKFRINLELDSSFSVLGAGEIRARLRSKDAATKLKSLLFYKSNAASLHVIKDEEALRRAVFAPVEGLPDALLFENFLGLANPGTSFTRILSGHTRLPILADGSCERVEVETAIGARSFSQHWRRFFPPALCISPPEWHFSMKYCVNRVYDYVCAMQNLGHSLEEIGFTERSPELGTDLDYRFLRNAHRMMLYFQELEELVMRSFNTEADFSYVSRSRFMRFMEIDGDKFRRDFSDMAVKGDLLRASEKTAFRNLKRKIETRARDRYVTGKVAMLMLLPPGFAYETVFKDKTDFKIRVPYTWSDLGYFVFDAVASRMERIVMGKIVPTLAELGMPEGEHLRYLGLAAEAGMDARLRN